MCIRDSPRATAKRAANQYNYDIPYECWQQFENNQPVAAWYSDNDSHGSLPTITAFENSKTYVYSIMLKPKDGYSFSSETVITVNGQKVAAPFVGGSMYIPSIKTITMPTVTVIDVVEINGVTVSFKAVSYTHLDVYKRQACYYGKNYSFCRVAG